MEVIYVRAQQGIYSLELVVTKDDRILEDRALGIYPNSVYALYTCI